MNNVLYKERMVRNIKEARTSFYHFVNLIYPPGGWFILGDFHIFLIAMVQAIVDGQLGKRHIVSVPPQHGKSTMLSVLTTAWVIGVFPGLQVAITGYSHDLSTTFSKKVKAIVRMPIYRLIFNVSIVESENRNDDWTLTNGSNVRAASVGIAITGRKVSWMVIDDPHRNRREAENPVARGRILEWYKDDMIPRLAPGSTVFIINTRWHQQDLSGSLTSQEYIADMILNKKPQEIFEITNLEAICTDTDADPLARPIGKALFPEVRDEEFLESIRLGMTNYNWMSQFQGKPIAAGQGQVDVSKINIIEFKDVPTHIEWFRAWDLALSAKKTADYSASTLGCYDKANDHLYLIDQWHGKKVWNEMKPEIVKIARFEKQEWGVNAIGIESVVAFSIGAVEVQNELMGEVHVVQQQPKGDKLMCAQPWLNKLMARKVSMVRGTWNRGFIDELQLFPAGAHDDRVDSVSRLAERFGVGGAGTGHLTYA